MSVALAEKPCVLHTIPGRLRVHLPGWGGQGKRNTETRLRQVEGVQSVQANALTGNVLIQFDPAVTNEQSLLAVVNALDHDRTDAPEPPPPASCEKQGQTIRARIAVRGLDRDPHLAKRVIEHLERRYPAVRARVNQLTVRRLSAVEALGRVDVVCTDKTGTMTEGHLTLSLIADSEQEARLPGEVPAHLRAVLLTGALASPHPDAPGATTHPTDVAVTQSAMDIGLGEQLQVQREAELSFDPVRSFHATIVQRRLCIKGAGK